MTGSLPEAADPRVSARWVSSVPGVLPLLLILFGVASYANGLNTPFVFDDHKWIVDDLELRALPDLIRGLADTNRPVLKLSLALN